MGAFKTILIYSPLGKQHAAIYVRDDDRAAVLCEAMTDEQ